MSTQSGQSGKSGSRGNREISLLFVIDFVAFLAITAWGVSHIPEQQLLTGGEFELRESVTSIAAVIAVWLAMLALSITVLWRRRRRGHRFELNELFIILLCAVTGLLAWITGRTSVIRFTPTEVTMSAPSWFGGETYLRLVYSQIDWLGKRERNGWEHDMRRTNIMTRMLGIKPVWKPKKIDECWVQLKDGEERHFDLSLAVNGACDNILRAAQAAGVTVKPVERIVEPKPTD